MEKHILITGGKGFIGRALVRELSPSHNVTAVDQTPVKALSHEQIHPLDITDHGAVEALLQSRPIDTIIHCAGIAHQKVGKITPEHYMTVNCQATEHLAQRAAFHHPKVHFIFLSSISVYGESIQGRIGESSPCKPSSDYATSKRNAEIRLNQWAEKGILKQLDILRLAPVYDVNFSLNLDRRVLSPGKFTYLRFGRGNQKLSALARPNLTGLVRHLVECENKKVSRVMNVCDMEPYTFGTIIQRFKSSNRYPLRPTLDIPLEGVKALTRLAGAIFPHQKDWWHACHDKLKNDLIFDNSRMLSTGFIPGESLDSIF
ncbi:MAG: NAD(P)-dependent oxidoreductase [Desulfobacterales bacterium]|nr:NAD(P)-dependent oxidoreductase [Desulfobacterales bacterium]